MLDLTFGQWAQIVGVPILVEEGEVEFDQDQLVEEERQRYFAEVGN